MTMTPPTLSLLRLSLLLLAAPSLSLTTLQVARARLRQTRQLTNDFRNFLGSQLIAVATGRMPPDSDTMSTMDEDTQGTGAAQVKKHTPRAPPVQAMLDSLPTSLAPPGAEPVSEDRSSAWLAQFERTRELTISTSPLIDACGSGERMPSPIMLAGHAKDYALTLRA